MLNEIQEILDEQSPERFTKLFCELLGWSRFDRSSFSQDIPSPVNQSLAFFPVAELGGLPVLRVEWPFDDLPNVIQKRAVLNQLKAVYAEHLLCYLTADGNSLAIVWARKRGEKDELRTLTFETGLPARTTLERIEELAFSFAELEEHEGEPPITAVVEKLNKAFDVEAVTKKFFEDYSSVFWQVEAQATEVPEGEPRRLYTQRLFNRLMFIYFIQKKGWLNFLGDKNYLRAIFNDAKACGEDFLNDRLYWLFFFGMNA
ncbi:hypothetical protein CEE37_05780 [candidate division LCP-89 bacterium B3_LCP]|uniref:Uncharacterized protein n=1 Tax=candidate division LCP-89 bacterium B3_LCP TaxID=2012998 RepID=A0A532V1W6_UNCL8|nr:MAG: hypothetical protein CEE37_05780 [candidate division LCP-89 bacterium B3_LCP]